MPCMSQPAPQQRSTRTPNLLVEKIHDRVERLLLRHDELQRTNQLLTKELTTLRHERDALRARLQSARTRIDALIARLPRDAKTDGTALPDADEALDAAD